jgi:hypothetical protein
LTRVGVRLIHQCLEHHQRARQTAVPVVRLADVRDIRVPCESASGTMRAGRSRACRDRPGVPARVPVAERVEVDGRGVHAQRVKRTERRSRRDRRGRDRGRSGHRVFSAVVRPPRARRFGHRRRPRFDARRRRLARRLQAHAADAQREGLRPGSGRDAGPAARPRPRVARHHRMESGRHSARKRTAEPTESNDERGK